MQGRGTVFSQESISSVVGVKELPKSTFASLLFNPAAHSVSCSRCPRSELAVVLIMSGRKGVSGGVRLIESGFPWTGVSGALDAFGAVILLPGGVIEGWWSGRSNLGWSDGCIMQVRKSPDFVLGDNGQAYNLKICASRDLREKENYEMGKKSVYEARKAGYIRKRLI